MIQFFKDLVLKDLPLKIFSLVLAIVLLATVYTVLEKNEHDRGVTMSSNKQFQGVPVEVVYASGDATGYRVKPATVTVFIQGTPEAIDDLGPASVKALVDLSYWDRRENLPLPVRILTPAGTAMVSVTPAEVVVLQPQATTVPQTAPES